ELLFRVVARVDLRECTQLGVRAEEEVDAAACPLDFSRATTPALKDVCSVGRGPPLRVHVEQVDEEVVGQRPRLRGKNADTRLPCVRVEDAQAADEHRQLGGGQCQHAGPFDQQILG